MLGLNGMQIPEAGKPRKMQKLVSSKGREVVTDLTGEEAIEILRGINKPFPQSLIDQYDRSVREERGERSGNLTYDQWVWVHTLAMEKKNPPQPERSSMSLNCKTLIDLFNKAAENKLSYPKIRVLFPDGSKIVFCRAGQFSKFPGTINVTDGGVYGENVWYGRIDLDGNFHRSRDCSDEVMEIVKEFAEDPAKAGKVHGLRTGNCCFCGLQLTDGRSVNAGYGPICAAKWGLPWG